MTPQQEKQFDILFTRKSKGLEDKGKFRDDWFVKEGVTAKAIKQFISSLHQPEIVICAAIKTRHGEVIRGHRHADAIHTALREGHKLTDLSFADQGFVTSYNRYVSRETGRKIQDVAGIPSASPEGYMPGTLFSEDLY